MGRKHILMEIFAIKFFEKVDPLVMDQILDENIVLTTNHNRSEYTLYDVSGDKSVRTNLEGHLILWWPECGIEIKDSVSLCPYYDPTCAIEVSTTLWNRFCLSDCFKSKDLETKNGFMEVNFAVYSDGVQAKIDVTLSDLELFGMPLAVYGTVTTLNSAIMHSQAKILLFERTRTDGVILTHPSTDETELCLPLSRSVMAIPRQSNLIVDINLFVQDISIVNSSVIFHTKTRSNTIAEEQIIVCSHGKVKVKVTWMEAVDDAKEEVDGGSAKEEEDRAVEEDEEEWAEEENDVENEGDEESESEFDTDDSSFRSLKSRRLNTQQDISTRSSDCAMKENVMMKKDGDQEASLDSKPPRRFKRSFLEVFSVKFFGSENVRLDEIYGFMMIGAVSTSRLLFRRVRGDPRKINSQGFALLEGPRRFAWEVCDEVRIAPFLFKYQGFHFENEDIYASYLWHNLEYDKVLCKTFDNEVGQIEVKFAVYKDGIETYLSIMLMDSLFSSSEVYGTITATNLKLEGPRVSSTVFDKEEPKGIEVYTGPRKDIALPLSRPIITLPHGSTLLIEFEIYSRKEAITCPPFVCPVQPVPSEKILSAKGCSVKMKVEFVYELPRGFGDYEGFF